MFDDDSFAFFLIGVTMIVIITILVYFIPKEMKRHDRAEEIATEMGCELIGSARDLNSVKFIDCNGEVRIVRVK